MPRVNAVCLSLSTRSTMTDAFYNCVDSYVPTHPGVKLYTEGGEGSVSLNNLRRLTKVCGVAVAFIAHSGRVLVLLADGSQYLATGFSYGTSAKIPPLEVKAFAEFAAENGFGEAEVLVRHLVGLPANFDGLIPWPGGL